MGLISNFWMSEIHLEVSAAIFESAAGLVELGIAVWILRTLKQIHEHPTSHEEDKKELLEAVFAVIAASLIIVPLEALTNLGVSAHIDGFIPYGDSNDVVIAIGPKPK